MSAPERSVAVERDTFRIPVLYPVLENKYYIDDFYMNGLVRPTMGPIADATLWVDMNVVDAVPNLTAGVARHAAAAVAVVDDNAVDGVYRRTQLRSSDHRCSSNFPCASSNR